jgi:hypothetical protein
MPLMNTKTASAKNTATPETKTHAPTQADLDWAKASLDTLVFIAGIDAAVALMWIHEHNETGWF